MYHSICIIITLVVINFNLSLSANNLDSELKEIEDDDSIVIEAPLERKTRQLFYASVPNWHVSALGDGNPCVTSKGTIGSCTSFRNCYPYFKIPDLSIWESWVLGNYDTCSFFNNDGRQAFGVCCSHRIPTTPSNVINDLNGQTIFSNKDNYYPSWPPPIPTHPPNHAAPTHPTVSGSLPTGAYPTTTTVSPSTTWPTKPSTPAIWPPPLPTHPSSPATVPSEIDNEIPSDGSCGSKNGFPDTERIVGGHNADPNEWPWIAVLFNGGRQFCGGSLIDNNHILTAAHCVAHMSSWDVSRLTVRLGDHNIKSNTEVKHVERKIKRVVRHKGFDSRTLYNDVAVLTMDSPVTFSRTVRAICLPPASSGASRQYTGAKGTVIGWGSLRENGPQPAILQEVTIPIWSNEECSGKYGPAAPGGIIDSMICAGQASKDSCSGDSGGPLMVNAGRWTQAGIVSWGIGCGKGQYPGVYTRISHFIPWITKNIKDGKRS